MASAVNPPARSEVTVRQTPSVRMLSPTAASSVTVVARDVEHDALAPGADAAQGADLLDDAGEHLALLVHDGCR